MSASDLDRIERIQTSVDRVNGRTRIEFFKKGKVTFCAEIADFELDQLIGQLQETRAALSPLQ